MALLFAFLLQVPLTVRLAIERGHRAGYKPIERGGLTGTLDSRGSSDNDGDGDVGSPLTRGNGLEREGHSSSSSPTQTISRGFSCF